MLTLSKSHDSLTLVWHSIVDNQLIEYYKVDYFVQPDEHDFLDSRDYCVNPRIEVNVGIESETPSAAQQTCNTEYEHWRLRNMHLADPEYAWRMHRKALCAEQASRLARGEAPLQIMKYIENHPINNCAAGTKCVMVNDFESIRFSRQIHDFITTSKLVFDSQFYFL